MDDTIVCSLDGTLRPMVREVFARVRADGHTIYVWSGVGLRWDEVERHGLADYVTHCYVKPLSDYRKSLPDFGVKVEPDFVVDDHKAVVDAFGGYNVRAYAGYDPADREMLAAYERLQEFTRPTRTELPEGPLAD